MADRQGYGIRWRSTVIHELVVPKESSAEAEEYTCRRLHGESRNVEAVRKHKDGTRVHVSILSAPVSITGSHICDYVIYRDITERKRAEQRLSESEVYLAEAQRLSQTGSWAWSPATGDIRYWSETCCRLLGFDPAGPLPRFEEFLQRIHPADQAPSSERLENAIHDKADFKIDYRIVHPERGIRNIHAVGHAVLDASSNLAEFVGTVIDVKEHRGGTGVLLHPHFAICSKVPIGRGTKAINPGGVGAKPPQPAPATKACL